MLAPGTPLGVYEVVAPLGAGGMGEVYKAKDTRLDRLVAIKILPTHVSSDPALRERFEREARTVAALNHPHICTLHDVGHQDGTDFLVMEYLDGETLERRLSKGSVPLDQTLTIATQIGNALAAAHRAGIVHRDLKPGNIMLTKSGAKLLDFGLAKMTPAVVAASGLSMAPTGVTPVTIQGTILGTLHYMAPEQVEGGEVDCRTDIFAFGAVLYEMVSGNKAFDGKTQASIIAGILERKPAPLAAKAVVPPVLDHIVTRCLAKNPDARWQTASDLAKELEWVATGSATPAYLATVRPDRIAWTVAAAAGGLAVAAIVLAIFARVGGRGEIASRTTRLAFARPAGSTVTNGGRPSIAISPDGSDIVFVADYQLYVRNLARAEAQPISGTALGQVYQPFFSPDGQWVGFVDADAGLIKKVPIAGGAAVTIASAGPTAGFGASWGADGRIVFANGDGIFRVSSEGGTPEKLVGLKPNEGVLRPQMLPDGSHLLYTLATGVGADRWDTASIVVEAVTTHERTVVLKGGADARYLETGHLVYALGDDLLAVVFDPSTRRPIGAPRIVEHGVLRSAAANTGSAQFVTSARGDLAYLPDAPVSNLLTLVAPGEGIPFGNQPFSGGAEPRISPDGSRLAVRETGDIWIYPLSENVAARRLTSAQGNLFNPIWTPDGTRIAFVTRTETGFELQWQRIDGGKAERIGGNELPIGWSRDGATRFSMADRKNTQIGSIQSIRAGQRPQDLWDATWGGSLSPDGQWLAFYRSEGNRNVVYVGSVNDPSKQYQVSKEGGHHPLWSRDGTRLYYARNSEGPATALVMVGVQANPTMTFGEPKPILDQILQPLNTDREYDVMPDGRILALVPDPRRSTRSGEVMVVQNWGEELKRLAPPSH